MSKKTYETLKDTMCYELDGLAKRGDINKETLDSMYKLIKSIKGLEQLTEMEEGKDGGYSMDYSRRMMRSPYMGRSYDATPNPGVSNAMYSNDGNSYHEPNSYEHREGTMPNTGEMSNDRGSYNSYNYSNARAGRDDDGDGRYSEDYSRARGRDARGRYTSRDRGYSRHSARDRVVQRLEDMLNESKSQSEQIAIMKCIEDLQD